MKDVAVTVETGKDTSTGNKSNLYTDKDTERLEGNQKVRDSITRELTKDGVPKNMGVIRVLLQNLADSDTSTNKVAENRARDKAADNTGASQDLVVEMIKAVKSKKSQHVKNVDTRVVDVSDEVLPLETVEGEKSIGVTSFDVADFTAPKKITKEVKE